MLLEMLQLPPEQIKGALLPSNLQNRISHSKRAEIPTGLGAQLWEFRGDVWKRSYGQVCVREKLPSAGVPQLPCATRVLC